MCYVFCVCRRNPVDSTPHTMGVITTCQLDVGTVFGPLSPNATVVDLTVLIGHRTCDTPPDIHTVRVIARIYYNFLLRTCDIAAYQMNVDETAMNLSIKSRTMSLINLLKCFASMTRQWLWIRSSKKKLADWLRFDGIDIPPEVLVNSLIKKEI